MRKPLAADAVERLREKVEEKIGRHPLTPTDFNFLALSIQDATQETISISTLKRVWAYVSNPHTASATTLSILSRFVGFTDWENFCVWFRGTSDAESGFLSVLTVRADELRPGDQLELTWNPGRRVVLLHEGGGRFRVMEKERTKLNVGDTFSASLFALHQPCYVTALTQADGTEKNYVAGERNGLTSLKLSRSPKTDAE